MGATLKEAAVRQNLALRAEKAARRDAALRQRELSAAELASRGGDAELPRADDSIPQLQLRGIQLAARMEGASKEKMAAARAFQKKRETAWEIYVLREAKAFEAEAVAKRQAGRAVLPQNAFAQERTREKDEAKKAREREPSSPTGPKLSAREGIRRRAPAGSLGAPEPSVLDRCCLCKISRSVEGVVLDVLIERMDEKYQTGRTWEQTRPPANRHR
jgi:hypothetical protein